MQNQDPRIEAAIQIILDKKGEDIAALDLRQVTDMTDYFVIATCLNERQAGAIADSIRKHLSKENGEKPLHLEGAGSNWLLLDYGDFVVHLFSPDARQYYALDALWGDAARLELPAASGE